jgi:hypothetical protein
VDSSSGNESEDGSGNKKNSGSMNRSGGVVSSSWLEFAPPYHGQQGDRFTNLHVVLVCRRYIQVLNKRPLALVFISLAG